MRKKAIWLLHGINYRSLHREIASSKRLEYRESALFRFHYMIKIWNLFKVFLLSHILWWTLLPVCLINRNSQFNNVYIYTMYIYIYLFLYLSRRLDSWMNEWDRRKEGGKEAEYEIEVEKSWSFKCDLYHSIVPDNMIGCGVPISERITMHLHLHHFWYHLL